MAFDRQAESDDYGGAEIDPKPSLGDSPTNTSD